MRTIAAIVALTLGACAAEVTAVAPPAGGYSASVGADGLGTVTTPKYQSVGDLIEALGLDHGASKRSAR